MLSLLPAELCDRIIDFVHDKRSLSNCSLVAKSWVAAARYHLFSSPRIFCGRDFDQTHARYLNSAPEGALLCAKHLSIIGVRHQTHRYSRETTILCSTIMDIIQTFPNVESIVLTDLQIVSTSMGDHDIPIRQPLRSLRSLVLDRISYAYAPSTITKEKRLFATLFQSFHSIEVFHIVENTFRPFGGDYGTPVSIPINSLRLRGLSSGGSTALVRFRASRPLLAFSFDPPTQSEFSTLSHPHAVDIFEHLRTLELCIDRCIGKYLMLNATASHVPAAEWSLSFAAFPAVNHLIINAFPKFGSYGDAFIVAIIDILSVIVRSAHEPGNLGILRALTLKLPTFRPPVSEERWSELGKTLCLLKETRHLCDMRIQIKSDVLKRSFEAPQRELMEVRLRPLFLDGTLKYETHREFF
ncbi:hypothetical protein QCA50_014907 [Cerrena zonata]|uniref:F-box domain-containing protein n=1 Tax=Cerrena zonata TaxID=2478898 RepID=A0AAW0FKJ0_9APHY